MADVSSGKSLAGRVVPVAALVVACSLVSAGAAIRLAAGPEGVGATVSEARSRLSTRLRSPLRPSLDEQYPPATECESCHPTHAAEWRQSAHSRAAVDPLVHASVCGRCHTPLGTQLDEMYQLKLYDGVPMPELPVAASEGVTCVTCHSSSHQPEDQVLTFIPEWPNWRSSDLALEIMPYGDVRGTFGAAAETASPAVTNDSHGSLTDPTLAESALCLPCHEVVVDKEPLAPHRGLWSSPSKVDLLTTYSEWLASPYAQPGAESQTCQSCHMPKHSARGEAAVAPQGVDYDAPLPDRELTDHMLAGVTTDYLSSGPDVASQDLRAAEHVAGAATLQVIAPPAVAAGEPVTVTVLITNTGAGHDLPTGFAYWSEAWLELSATDRDGRVLLLSGDVDQDEWLRDEFNPRVLDGELPYDPYLLSLRARLVSVGPNRERWRQPDGRLVLPDDDVLRNLNGTPIIGTDADVAIRLWRELLPGAEPPVTAYGLQEGYYLRHADTVLRRGVPAGKALAASYSLPGGTEAADSINVSARLLIRALWPWMLQQQQELPTPWPRPPIYVIGAAGADVDVVAP